MAEKKDLEEYIKALENELLASIEREEALANDDLKVRVFMGKKIKSTSLYKNVISNPSSKIGTVIRAPRSVYRIVKNPEVRKSLMQKKTVGGEVIKEGKVHFLAPWSIDVKLREKIAEDALKEGRKLALYFVEKPDSSTFRYRCYNTFEATMQSKKWQAVYFFKTETKVVEKLLPKCSLLVMGRQSGQEKLVAKFVKLAHLNNIKVGLDIDDLVFDMKYIDLMLDTIGEKINRAYWVAYFASVQAMSKQMDYFITTNDFLKERLKESYDKPCVVIRNSLNQEQIEASMVYVKQKEKQVNDKEFSIGYFSGSPTHAKDFAVAEPEVIDFLKSHDNTILNVVGFMQFSKEAEKLIKAKRIRFLPMTDFRKLQKLMSEVDVNIAPLVMNDFTNCKSELKFFEAAIVETTTIASPTYTFEKAISDGKNGFLAEAGCWREKMEFLYQHPEENRKIAKKAKDYALKNYTGKVFLDEVEAAYNSLSKEK